MPDPSLTNLTQITLAVGALGTAATGLVDTTKVFSGGLSRAGFGHIKTMMAKLYLTSEFTPGLPLNDVLDTLLANWMNGMKLADQKSAAKSLIKLQFNSSTAQAYAALAHVDPVALGQVADNMANAISAGAAPAPGAAGSTSPAAMTAAMTDAFGRFDLALTARIDQGYQRADQFYRNSAKAMASVFAVGLAYAGNATLPDPLNQFHHLIPLIVGLIATPLAPIAKDLSSAISTAATALKTVRR